MQMEAYYLKIYQRKAVNRMDFFKLFLTFFKECTHGDSKDIKSKF